MVEPSDDFATAANEALQALQWQLGHVRVTYLNPRGLDARRRQTAARSRVMALVSGVPDADLTVIARMLSLAAGTPGLDGAPPSPALDAALQAALDSWRDMDLPDYWETLAGYVRATRAGVAEQVLLLTYLDVVLSGTRSGTKEPGPTPVEMLAAVNAAWLGDTTDEVYAGCGALTRSGVDASLEFSTRIAMLVLAGLTLSTDQS